MAKLKGGGGWGRIYGECILELPPRALDYYEELKQVSPFVKFKITPSSSDKLT